MFLYKRKYLVFTMIFLVVLSLIGCNEEEDNQPKNEEKHNKIEIVKLDEKR